MQTQSPLTIRSALCASLAIGLSATALVAQVPGTSREQMWYAPTTEDWKKPVLITFQRSWEDAVAVSRETGKAILVCTNMDGEIASEHYAGVRYRQPDIAKLYEPYVCVMASVYRHNPRDHDENGQRILCPRFGSVTCGEHIAIEPILYDKFFDGVRVAPRHVMVELDGSETYDVYYAFDTDSVFNTIRDGIANREAQPNVVTKGDRSIVERVASRDVDDRDAVEQAFAQGDRNLRQSLLDAAMKNIDKAPTGLLRQAVFGLDVEQSKQAIQALTRTHSVDAVDLIAEAMRTPMEQKDRDALIGALDRLAGDSPKARSLAVVYRGLNDRSEHLDSDRWAAALPSLAASATEAVAAYEKAARLQRVDEAAADKPDDPAVRLEMAEANLAMAIDEAAVREVSGNERQATRYTQLMFEDARRAALEAERLGATGWRVHAAVAIASHYLDDMDEAGRRADLAIVDLPEGATEWNAMAVLGMFAESRMRKIREAILAKERWDRKLLSDIRSAYAVLLKHPESTEGHVVLYYDFIKALDARGEAARVLDAGLQRYPKSWALHARLRDRILRERGVRGLEAAYADRLQADVVEPGMRWFAAYASLIAAEFHRRRSRFEQAVEAYDRAIAGFDRVGGEDPSQKGSCDHYAAICLHGQGRMAFEAGDYATSVAKLEASFVRSPASSDALDGLNLSAVETAKQVLSKLKDEEMTELHARLERAMSNLEAERLEILPWK